MGGMAIVSNNNIRDSVLAGSTVLSHELQFRIFRELTTGSIKTLLILLNECSSRSCLRDLELIYREALKLPLDIRQQVPAIIVCSIIPEPDLTPQDQGVPHYGYGVDLTPGGRTQPGSVSPNIWPATHDLDRLAIVMIAPPNGDVSVTQHQVLEEIGALCDQFRTLPNLRIIELYCVVKHARDAKIANLVFLHDALELMSSVALNLQHLKVRVIYREHLHEYSLTRNATWECLGGPYNIPETPELILAGRIADIFNSGYMKLRRLVLKVVYRPKFAYLFGACHMLLCMAVLATLLKNLMSIPTGRNAARNETLEGYFEFKQL